MTRTALLGAVAAACWLAAGVRAAEAAEVVVEPLTGARKYAPLWPGGTFEHGGDAGFSRLRVVTDGQAGGTFLVNVRPYQPALDFRGRFVKVWVKVDDIRTLGGMEFRLSSDRFARNFYAFSFPMYDDEDFNVLRDGVWTELTFSFGGARVEGSPDRSNINSIGWYVSDRGNGEPVTAWWGGLAMVDEPLEGVVSITFDDGYDEHYRAAEIMAKHGMAGVAYVIPSAVGQVGYMTLHQLVALQDRFGWDVAAHHQTPFTDLRPDELEATILGVQRYLVENEFGKGAGHLAYPLGRQNTSLVRPLVRKHFTTARVASAGPETLPPGDPHLLRALNVTSETSPEEVVAAVRRAQEHKEWLILMLHYLVEGEPENVLEYSVADFEKLVEGVAGTGVRVLTLSEVWDACGACSSVAYRGGPCTFPQAVASPD